MITHLGWSECLNVCLITFTLNNWEETVLLGNIFKGTYILKQNFCKISKYSQYEWNYY